MSVEPDPANGSRMVSRLFDEFEEHAEVCAEHVVGDGQLLRGLALVGNVVGRVGEHRVGQPATERPLQVDQPRGVPAEKPVFLKEP
jgi:hypothetical protein